MHYSTVSADDIYVQSDLPSVMIDELFLFNQSGVF